MHLPQKDSNQTGLSHKSAFHFHCQNQNASTFHNFPAFRKYYNDSLETQWWNFPVFSICQQQMFNTTVMNSPAITKHFQCNICHIVAFPITCSESCQINNLFVFLGVTCERCVCVCVRACFILRRKPVFCTHPNPCSCPHFMQSDQVCELKGKWMF